MFSPVQDFGLHLDEFAFVLAAVGALILGLKDCAMNLKSRAPHDDTDEPS